MRSDVPIVLLDLIADFAYDMPAHRLWDEVCVCAAVQECVPPCFLKPHAWYRSMNWGHVNNPFRRGNHVLPITHMQFLDPWSHLPETVCTLLCRRRVREAKTYKGIFFRRQRNMSHSGLLGWNEAFALSWCKLRPEHFKPRAIRALSEGVCEELGEASQLPQWLFSSPAWRRVLQLYPAAL